MTRDAGAVTLRIWIDATGPAHAERIFGMSLLERLLRAIAAGGVRPNELRVEHAPGAPPAIAPDLAARLPLRLAPADGPLGARLARALRAGAGEPLIAFSADAVVDPRLVGHLASASGNRVFTSGAGPRRAALLRVEDAQLEIDHDAADLAAVAGDALRAGAAKELTEEDFPDYVTMLRRRVPPYLLRVEDPAAKADVERFLFWSNYKGSTDFLTRWVFPPAVWALVRPLARWRVHPNWVTALDWIAAFACVPFFAAGAWLPGLAVAYAMAVLDSVDGKLARLTFTDSRLGEVLDHGLDVVHPPFWYVAWGLAFGGGDPDSAPARAALWMVGAYAVDRAIAGVFKWRVGVSIHGATPLDERVRTFIARRNPFLAALTLALAADQVAGTRVVGPWTFYAMAGWQVLCTVWHAERLLRFWSRRRGAHGEIR